MLHTIGEGNIGPMKRVTKPEGAFNIVVEEVEAPSISDTEVLVKADRSLISRGSELWRRYVLPEAIDPAIVGYLVAGTIAEVGARVGTFSLGDRVAAVAPHAEYTAIDVKDHREWPPVVHMPDDLPTEHGTFWPLATSAVLWVEELGLRPGDTVVFIGQGLVGSLCLQVAKHEGAARVVAVDALPSRCRLAQEMGADVVIDASADDPVEVVMELTGGRGAEVVVEAVGGPSGVQAFDQALDMVAPGGLVQILGLYEGQPLQLDSGRIQGKTIVGGHGLFRNRPHASRRALRLLADGDIDVASMITHRFPFAEAKAAFDLLYERPQDTFGVILEWD